MPELVLDLCGGPRLRGSDGPFSLSPYQGYALTVVGEAGPGGVDRGHLAWLLWEEDATPASRQRIRQLLHGLRRRTGVDLFAACSTATILLDRSIVRTDLDLVADHLSTGRLREAATIVAREVGAELTASPTREFEDWLDAVRTTQRQRVRAAAARAWDAGRSEGDWTRARDAAEAAYLLAPDDEDVLRMILQARSATGALQGARVAFALFTERRGPGAPVSPTTEALVERVDVLQASLERSDDRMSLPLIGRRDQMRRLRAATLGQTAPPFGITIVRGDAGIGKTRLAEELAREARLSGVTPLATRAVEPERRIPMNVLMDALGQIDVVERARRLAQPWQTLVGEFLPADADLERRHVPPIQAESLTRRLMDAFTRLLTEVAADGPILLCIDDLQWADDTTLSVLRFAQRRWTDGRIAVVGTIRTESVPRRDSPAGVLGDFLAAADTVLDVPDLDDESARELIRAAADHDPSEEELDRIATLGGRNPFYLVELTRESDGGRSTAPVVPAETVALPISLQDLFDRRFNGLETLHQRLAELLAVRARPMRIDHLARLVGADEEHCALAVDELVANRLVRVERGVVAIRHELFRNAFYRRISPARVAVLHDRIARLILETCDPHPPGELAVHFSKAGRSEEAVTYGRQAADQAVKNGASAEAAYFLEMILECEEDEERVAEATGDLAQLLHSSREMARAEPMLDVAGSRLRRAGRPDRAIRMDVRRVECRAEVDGVPLHESLERLEEIKSEARDRDDWEARAVALDTHLHLLHQEGVVEPIQAVFEEMRACTRSGSAAAACLAHSGLALNILFGDPSEALASAREAVRLAAEEGQREHLLMAQTRLVLVLTCLARLYLDEGQSAIEGVRNATNHAGDIGILLDANVATFFIDAADYHFAQEALDRAAPVIRKLSIRWPRFNFAFNCAELHLCTGQYDEAANALARARAFLEDAGSREVRDLLGCAEGLCELGLGKIHSAVRRFDGLPPLTPDPTVDPTLAVLFRARVLERIGRASEAIDLTDACRAPLRERFTGAWIKLSAYQARATRRHIGKDAARAVAEEAAALCAALQMVTRERQFRAWLG